MGHTLMISDCASDSENAFIMSTVVSSYLAQRSPKVEQQPILFAVLDFKDGRDTFGMMRFETVPRMLLLKASG